MSLNNSQSIDYRDKSNESFLNTTNASISTVTTGCPSDGVQKYIINNQHNERQKKSHVHFNRMWSVWYGILLTIFQGYLLVKGFQKYIGCSLLTWKHGFPTTELNMQLIFCGLTLLFLPLFLASAIFKVGNLANDGVKLSAKKTTCSSDPTTLFSDEPNSNTMKSLWMHGVPISVFIHIVTALCLLLPHLLLESKLIQNQHLPKDNIWKSEIDFLLNKNDRLVILSFINTSPYQNNSDLHNNNNRFDENVDGDDIDDETLDEYDLNSFETHESMKFRPKYDQDTTTSNPYRFQIGSIEDLDDDEDDDADDFDSDYNPFSENFPMIFSTHKIVTSTEEAIPITTSTIPSTTSTTTTTTTTTTTEATTLLITDPPTTTVTTTTTTEKITTTPSTTSTSTSTVSTPSTMKTTTNFENFMNFTALYEDIQTKPVTVEAKTQTGKSKSSHKNRKHNHKKHHRQHTTASTSEIVEDNQEFRLEDFDNIDPELIKIETSKMNNGKKRVKNNGKQSASSSESKTSSSEVQKSTTTFTPDKTRNRNHNKENVNSKRNPSTSSSYMTTIDTPSTHSNIIKIKKTIKRSVDNLNNDENMENYYETDGISNTVPSINEDDFIIKDDDTKQILSPLSLIGSVPNFTQSNQLDAIGRFLQSIVGGNAEFDPKLSFQNSPNLEFVNLALALLVWSVRYPSVFWESSKAFAMVFSFQLIVSSVDILMLYVGASILFKIQIVGEFMTVHNHVSPLILNGIVTLALTLLAFVLIISSSMILYLYGHSRLARKIRDCQTITLKEGDVWSYFSHCASLCFLLALAVVKAPIIHDLKVTYQISFDKKIFAATIMSINHIVLWVLVWLALTAKRRWNFKLPMAESIYQARVETAQPLLASNSRQINFNGPIKDEETIYWPAGSPKLKVTFDDEVPNTLTNHKLIIDHNGKRPMLSTDPNAGEMDEGEYATLKNTVTAASVSSKLQFSEYDEVINIKRVHVNDNGYDDTSEEGKLLACVQDETVTYASTRVLEPPKLPSTSNSTIYERFVVSSENQVVLNSITPVTVQVHSEHLTSTPRFLRRGDSGMPPNEALTPKSDTNSTESSASPPERALSESSSGIHSSEENKDEVVIRARANLPSHKAVKPPPAVIEEEPYGRITSNMKMSSFKDSPSSSNTLPHSRPAPMDHSCNTMPMIPSSNIMNRMSINESPKQHTTLPSNVRYSAGGGNYMRQMSQMKNAESPYATGLGSGHHTFSRFIQNEPLPPPPIPQSHSQQLYGLTNGIPQQPTPQINHFNTTTAVPFAGLNRSYQMVLNEMCANNNQSGQFPPPPPSIAH